MKDKNLLILNFFLVLLALALPAIISTWGKGQWLIFDIGFFILTPILHTMFVWLAYEILTFVKVNWMRKVLAFVISSAVTYWITVNFLGVLFFFRV